MKSYRRKIFQIPCASSSVRSPHQIRPLMNTSDAVARVMLPEHSIQSPTRPGATKLTVNEIVVHAASAAR